MDSSTSFFFFFFVSDSQQSVSKREQQKLVNKKGWGKGCFSRSSEVSKASLGIWIVSVGWLQNEGVPGRNMICNAKWWTSTSLWRKAVSCGYFSQPGGCARSLFQTPSAAATLERWGLQAEQKDNISPTCLSLPDPPCSPGEHLVTSLQDILGRISLFMYVVGAFQDSDLTKSLSSQVGQIPGWKPGN